MAQLTTQEITQDGIGPTYASATSTGDTFIADGRTFLHVKNGGGSPVTVTVTAVRASVGLAGFGDIPIDDISVSVPATTGDKMIAVDPAGHASAGVATVTYSGVTSLTIAAIRGPQK